MSIVQSGPVTTQRGGVTGPGFQPGQSGNPGGRPKGLSRRVRELVGDDGHAIVEFMLDAMNDETARNAEVLGGRSRVGRVRGASARWGSVGSAPPR